VAAANSSITAWARRAVQLGRRSCSFIINLRSAACMRLTAVQMSQATS
jgi:hypothetical protein